MVMDEGHFRMVDLKGEVRNGGQKQILTKKKWENKCCCGMQLEIIICLHRLGMITDKEL